jgi:hypothetical protein
LLHDLRKSNQRQKKIVTKEFAESAPSAGTPPRRKKGKKIEQTNEEQTNVEIRSRKAGYLLHVATILTTYLEQSMSYLTQRTVLAYLH